MSKETREMLKTIISNQELMMKHLKMEMPADNGKKSKKPETKMPADKAQKPTAKKASSNKSSR